MIVINATIETSDADILALKSAIAAMETASREEAGCEDYTFSVELNDPNKLRITERWESVEALQAHFATEHMATFSAALANHPPKGMALSCYEATEIPLPKR